MNPRGTTRGLERLMAMLTLVIASPVLAACSSDPVLAIELRASAEAIARGLLASGSYFPGAVRVGNGGEVEALLRFDFITRECAVRQRPHIHVQVEAGSSLPQGLGVRHVVFDASEADPSLLRAYWGSLLAESLALRSPPVGHATVRFNGKPLGVFVWCQVVDEEASGIPVEQSLEPGNVHRLLAWEVFGAKITGSYFTDTNRLWLLPSSVHGVELGLTDYHGLFELPQLHVLARGGGQWAPRFLRTESQQRRFLGELAAVATNATVGTQWLAALESRAEWLRQHLQGANGPAFEAAFASLKCAVRARLDHVRAQATAIQALPSLASPPVVRPEVRYLRHRELEAQARSAETECQVNRFDQLKADAEHSAAFGSRVTRIHLQCPVDEWSQWRVESTNWILARATCGEDALDGVGLRLQGHRTRQDPQGKPSLTLKFNHQVNGQSWRGYTKVHLHNALHNPSYLNEFLMAWLCRQVHYPCPEVSWARVSVNNRDYGLYVVVEGTTRAFLAKHFGTRDGALFEGEGWDIDARLDLDSASATDPYPPLQALAQLAREAVASRSLHALTNACSLPELATYVALEMTLGHLDGYSFHFNNYRIFQHPRTRRYVLLPHGTDELRPGLPLTFPPPVHGVLAKALLAAPEGQTAYGQALAATLGPGLDLDSFLKEAAVLCREIELELLRTDPVAAARQSAAAINVIRLLATRKAGIQSLSEPRPHRYTQTP